jgi:hypothetical protein
MNAGALAGAVRQYFVGYQPAAVVRFGPPDAIIWLLELALLPEIPHGKEH